MTCITLSLEQKTHIAHLSHSSPLQSQSLEVMVQLIHGPDLNTNNPLSHKRPVPTMAKLELLMLLSNYPRK